MDNTLKEIDLQILNLLQKRQVFLSQRQHDNNLNPCSEFKVDEDIFQDLSNNSLTLASLRAIFREIEIACHPERGQIRVAYLGPQGTFAQAAALKQFGHQAGYLPSQGIEGVFDEVEKGRADFGVVPIENSTEGTVNITLDRLVYSNTRIHNEIFLVIHQYLLSHDGKKETIDRIFSHPHALAQCRNWLALNLPGVPLLEVSSTAKAAEMAIKDRNCAAIASEMTAHIYNLKVVASSIEDNLYNYTRFLVISREEAPKCSEAKTSLLVFIKDKVGALFEMLGPFSKYGINLTKIESRPSKKKPWEYIFFIDILGHKEDVNVQKALQEIEEGSQWLKILGSYPKGELPD